MKRIIELSENDYKALKEDGIQNHITLANTIIANSLPYEEKLQDNLIHSLTELCNKYCKNCPVTYAPNDCTDCIITHIRGIIGEVMKND